MARSGRHWRKNSCAFAKCWENFSCFVSAGIEDWKQHVAAPSHKFSMASSELRSQFKGRRALGRVIKFGAGIAVHKLQSHHKRKTETAMVPPSLQGGKYCDMSRR